MCSLTQCKSTLVRANGEGTGGTSVCVVPCALDSMCVCVYEGVGGRGLGSLMMRIKGLLNCEGVGGAKLRETDFHLKQATKIRTQDVHTTSAKLTYNHSRLQTRTHLHKLWRSALQKGGHIPTAQLWSKLAQGKLNRKDKAGKER